MSRVIVLENARVMGSYENTCIVVEDKYIVDVGGPSICEKYDSVDRIDVGGRVVIPGLIDAHLHLGSLALMHDWVDLRGVKSIEELKNAISSKAKTTSGWVLGRGWDHELFVEKRLPTRWDLDEAVSDKPVVIVRICGHVAVANTMALKLAGILDKIPRGYEHLVGREGNRINGVLFEDAVKLVLDKAPKPSLGELADKIHTVLRRLASYGITTVHSMDATMNEYRALEILRKEGRLPIRVRVFLSLRDYKEKPNTLTLGDEWLSIRGVKVFADGSFGGRTAALLEPYSDDPGNYGKLLLSKDSIGELARSLAGKGLSLAVHAIGDRAVLEVSKAIKEYGLGNVRIEHASLTPPEVLDELVSHKPYSIVVQPHFTISDWWLKSRLGERAKYAYMYKTMISRGLVVAAGSDAPVEPVNPWLSLSAAITRGRLRDINPYEKLSISEALAMYTRNASIAGLDKYLGNIRKGFYADLVVVDENPWGLYDEDVAGIKPVLVIVGGRIVYDILH